MELMNSISIVQCVYKENPYILESLKLNLKAIEDSKFIDDYEYIIFNDKGDKSVYESISNIVENDKNIRYVYSDINFGKKKITTSIQFKNLYGVQFHPEKSGKDGIKIIKSFLNQIKT